MAVPQLSIQVFWNFPATLSKPVRSRYPATLRRARLIICGVMSTPMTRPVEPTLGQLPAARVVEALECQHVPEDGVAHAISARLIRGDAAYAARLHERTRTSDHRSRLRDAYGMKVRLRLAVPFFPTAAMDDTIRMIILVLAVIGIVYGALVSLVQPDFKKLVAYSSVSHLGFVMLGIFALTEQSVQGALMVMINHGLSTGALFFLIGMIYERRHTREIAAYGGIARVIPLFATLLVIVALSSIGVPGTNGFVGEFLVLIGSFRTYPVLAVIATVVVILAAAYLLWAVQRIIFNALDKPENEHIPDLNRRELLVMAPLIAAIIWMGVYPAPILRRTEAAAERFVRLVETRSAVEQASTVPGGVR